MWTRTPLAIKITVPLILMQISGIVFGGLALVAKIEDTRLSEIDSLLRGQADLVEESLRYSKGGVPHLAIEGEVIREMEHDPRLYFIIVGPDRTTHFASQGPLPRISQQLGPAILAVPSKHEEPFDISFGNERWRAMKEVLDAENRGTHPFNGNLFLAVDLKAAMAPLATVRKLIFAAAILLSVITTVATAAIVSLTTSNLRLLARSLGAINPLAPAWSFRERAQTAEERLLFTSFRTLIEEIRKARQKQSLFIASASHELKTPVAAMMTALEVLLAKERSVHDYQETCRDLLKTTRDLRRLTGTLLNLALLESDAQGDSGRLDLRDVLKLLYERWTREVKGRGRGISLSCRTPEGPCFVTGNMELLEVALGNFIDNAVKYSHAGGRVEVSLHAAADGHHEVRIKDQGIGIAAADLEKLGDLFFRADASRAALDSFGLGFSHAKRILASFGATVQVRSQPEKGTEVTVLFPSILSEAEA